jgi:hypothetical protein
MQVISLKMKNNQFTVKHFPHTFIPVANVACILAWSTTHLHCPGTFLSQIPAQPKHVGLRTFFAIRHQEASAIGGLLE